jgi:electron transport complex protein RnfB
VKAAGAFTDEALTGRILDALPQTQCTRCGYPDCAGYAQAISQGDADINQCPPGGEEGVARLAALTDKSVKPLNPDYGQEGRRTVAFIDENWCIGCTLCIAACPTDAIIGSNKRMHTIIEEFCTGCELCLPVCPVDCILLENASGEATGWKAWSPEQAAVARQRNEFSSYRRKRDAAEHDKRLEEKARMKLADLPAQSLHTDPAVLEKKRAVIEAALERARQKRLQPR